MKQRSSRFFISYFFTSLFLLLLLPALPRDASGKEAVDPYYLWHLFTGSAIEGAETLSSVAVDEGGNIFIAAESMKWKPSQETDPAYGNPGQPLHWHSGGAKDNKDIMVAKFDTDGKLLWYTYYGGLEYDSVRGMAIAGGKLYITGTSRDNWAGPKGEPAVNQHSRAITYYFRDGFLGFYGHNYSFVSADVYVLALNADSGRYLWHTFHGESGIDEDKKIDEEVYGIAADSEYVFLTGKADYEFFGCWPKLTGESDKYVTKDDMERVERLCQPTRAYQGSNDAWVMALRASDGGWVKHTFLGGSESNDWGEAIAIDKDGFPVVAGSSSKEWKYDNHVHYNASPRNSHSGGYDMFIARLARKDLEYHWHAFFGGPDDDWATAVLTDDHNSYYLTGYSKSGWNVKERAPVDEHTPGVNFDFAVVKMNNEGANGWHTFRGALHYEDVPRTMALSGDGETVYVAGESYCAWKISGDGYALHRFSGKLGTVTDMAVLGLDADNGQSRWHTFWGGAGNDRAYSLATSPSGDIIVAGTSDATWQGDKGQDSKYTFPTLDSTKPNSNFTILKLCPYKHEIKTSVFGDKNGTITPGGKVLVKAGADQTFTFKPSLNYRVARVILDGVSHAWSTNTYTISKVAGDHELKVVFETALFTITSSAGNGGTINPGDQSIYFGNGQEFTVSASVGYVIDTLTVCKGTTCEAIKEAAGRASYTYTFTNVQANGSIKATFKAKTYTITPSAGSGGTINPGTAQTIGRGTNSKAFIVSANTGYAIDTLTVCKGTTCEAIKEAAGRTSYMFTFLDVQANGSIKAAFKETCSITVLEGNGGSVSPGDQVVMKGSNITFKITADTSNGYAIDTLTVDGSPVAEASGRTTYDHSFTNVTGNHTIKATFKKREEFIITVQAGQNGTISPGTSQNIARGARKTFVITANDGYGIDALKVDGNTVYGASGGSTYMYSFAKVDADHTISATFKQAAYTITASAGNNGAIEPSGAKTYSPGATPTYKFMPADGYLVDAVTVDGAAVLFRNNQYTFPALSAGHEIRVAFRKDTYIYTITAYAGKNGAISDPGETSHRRGTTPTYTFTPADGYVVDAVTVDGDPVAFANNQYTFPALSAKHTIKVTFRSAAKTYTITPSAGTGGGINPSTAQTVSQGGSRDFTVSAGTGYLIDTLTVTRGTTSETITAASGQASYTYSCTNVQADGSIIATFRQKPAITYTITATASGNGSITPSGDVSVTSGESQTFTMKPVDGYEVEDVLVDNISRGATTIYTFSNVTGNHTITVSFKQKPAKTYTITPSAGTGGGINPSTAQTVSQGGSRDFIVSVGTGYLIDTLTVTRGTTSETITAASGQASYTYSCTNVQADGSIIATFTTSKFYTITGSAGDGGSISPTKAIAKEGQSVTFEFTPNDATFEVDTVTLDNGPARPWTSRTYTMENVTGNHTIYVTFKR